MQTSTSAHVAALGSHATRTSDRIIRRPEVQSKTGLPCSSLYEKMAKGQFPKPIKLGERSVGWRESEIDAWIASREAASRQVA